MRNVIVTCLLMGAFASVSFGSAVFLRNICVPHEVVAAEVTGECVSTGFPEQESCDSDPDNPCGGETNETVAAAYCDLVYTTADGGCSTTTDTVTVNVQEFACEWFLCECAAEDVLPLATTTISATVCDS